MADHPPAENEVHLWFLQTDVPNVEALCKESLDLLSPDESERYRSMRHPGRARQYLLGRLLMRRSLAAHMHVTEAELKFVYGPNGKPALDATIASDLAFSLSHAGTTSVMAIAPAEKVGVDLELLDRAPSVLRIARRFFSEAELRHLRGKDEHAAVMALWGLKESIVKANGTTVWEGLSAVRLIFDGDRVLWLTPPPDGHDSDWLLMSGRYRANYSLALAVKRGQTESQPLDVIVHVMGAAAPTDSGLKVHYASDDVTTRSSSG